MFKTEVFDGKFSTWESIREKVVALEEEAFDTEPFPEDVLKADFLSPHNVVVLLRKVDSKELTGFTYAKPREPETPDSPAKPGETAWAWDTVIQKEHRGKGLLGLMMEALEKELRSRGFKYLERNAMVANNFASNIKKHYKERIIKSFPLDSAWGPQIFFRIKL